MTDMSLREYYIFRVLLKTLYLRNISHHTGWTTELSLKCLKKGQKAILWQKCATYTWLISEQKSMQWIFFCKISFLVENLLLYLWIFIREIRPRTEILTKRKPNSKNKLKKKKVRQILHKLCVNFLNTCFSIYTTDQERLESNFKSNNLHIDVWCSWQCTLINSVLSGG